jgi:LCP family protein required for cell wall assembly
VSDRTSTDVPHVLTTWRTPQQRSERVKLRRALTFLAMTLVLPGSAQTAAGNKRLGRFALRAWAGLWVLALLIGLFALVWRSAAVDLFTAPAVLRLLQITLIVLGAGWAILFVDAWRISRPPDLAPRHRLAFSVLSIGLAVSVVGGLMASASMVSAQRDLMSTVFAGGGDKEVKQGRYNILLMGGDAGRDRVGLRPDSMTVASVDAETGRTVLVSLPRNLEGAPFPEYSPLHKKFPDGYKCDDGSCMLNAIYTYATEHKNLYPGVANPGAQATKEAIEGSTGLMINYWALIDLKGFEALVDAVGGITMDVYRKVPIGGGSTKISGYVEAGKARHLTGYEALWFARSRADSSDYDRIVRQKCVMTAMLNQLDPMTVLTKFNRIARASKQVVATDIPTSDINTMLDLAVLAKQVPVSSVAIMPPLIEPGDPDFAVVRAAVQEKIAQSEAADAKAANPDPTPSVRATPKAKKKPKADRSRTAQTSNLAKVCAA